MLRDAALRAPPQDEGVGFYGRPWRSPRCPVARIVGNPLINLESCKEKDFHFLAPDFHFLALDFHFLASDFRFLAADFHFLAAGLAFLSCARRWAWELQTAGNGAASLWKGSIHARQWRPHFSVSPPRKAGVQITS
jgi:hypothetical protein